jgi:hypothetical protein
VAKGTLVPAAQQANKAQIPHNSGPILELEEAAEGIRTLDIQLGKQPDAQETPAGLRSLSHCQEQGLGLRPLEMALDCRGTSRSRGTPLAAPGKGLGNTEGTADLAVGLSPWELALAGAIALGVAYMVADTLMELGAWWGLYGSGGGGAV